MKFIARYALILMVLALLIRGTNSVVVKVATDTMNPIVFGGIKFMLAGILFSLISFNKPLKNPKLFLKQSSINVMIGLGFSISWLLGVHYSSAINMAVFSLLVPIFVYVGSIVFLHEPKSNRALAGSLIALIGGLILIVDPIRANDSFSYDLLGNLLLFISVIIIASGVIYKKRILRTAEVEQILAFQFVGVGLILLLGYSALGGGIDPESFFITQNLLIISIGALVSFTGAYLFNLALKRMRAEDTAPLFYLENVSAFTLSALVLNETLDDIAIIATAVIIVGVLIAHPVHVHRMHYYLDPTRHTFEEFFHWLKLKYGTFERAVKKII